MKKKIKVRGRLKALSPEEQMRMQRFWNEKLLNDPLPFIPKAEREKRLNPTEARKINEEYGKFAEDYLIRTIRRLTDDSDVIRRRKLGRKFVLVGYGRGYDSRKSLRHTLKAGFQTWCIDVSTVAWMWATEKFRRQFHALRSKPEYAIYKEPVVRSFEIQSLLAEPETADLDLASVEIWFLSRLLNCLPTESAKAVLQEIGRTALGSDRASAKRNAVIIINALCDDNPCCCTCGGVSITRSKKMIFTNLGYGAKRPLEVRFVRHYQYFGKLITAMTIMAK